MSSMPSNALGRTGDPDDLAKAVLFMASDLASYVSGTSLTLDGAQTLREAPVPCIGSAIHKSLSATGRTVLRCPNCQSSSTHVYDTRLAAIITACGAGNVATAARPSRRCSIQRLKIKRHDRKGNR
jgi:hypothetical protein